MDQTHTLRTAVLTRFAVIRVRDNGIGIAADQLPRIFEMFVQVDTSLERWVSGLGIDLTLVKNLVEMHDGTISVHSAGAGHGSEFVVRLSICDLRLPMEEPGDESDRPDVAATGRSSGDRPFDRVRCLIAHHGRPSTGRSAATRLYLGRASSRFPLRGSSRVLSIPP